MITYKDRINTKNDFSSLSTIDDLANFLNTTKKQLLYYSIILPEVERYKNFSIPKKSGGFREIAAPVKTLKYIQKQLSSKLQVLYEPMNTVHGFISQYEDKNHEIIKPTIITNAAQHIRKRNILNIDLENFFPSINKKRVYGLFKKQYSLNSKISSYLTFICCTEDGLPQGAPTSPIITNMICSRLDRKLRRLSSKNYVTYSRYADDLAFSTSRKSFTHDFENNIREIIQEEGFLVNEKKRRLSIRENRMEVTGLTVNVKTNVQREYVRSLRAIFHSIMINGLQKTANDYLKIKGINSKNSINSLSKYLKGKIEFLGQVKGKDDPIFIKFNQKYLKIFMPEKLENKILLMESAEFTERRNVLLSKYNDEIVSSIEGTTEELKNIKNRINDKLDKARKTFFSPDKNNYLETVFLLWYSCLNEFQKIHFEFYLKYIRKLDGNEVDTEKYFVKWLNLPGYEDFPCTTIEQTRYPFNPKQGRNISSSISIYLNEKMNGQSVFELAWLNEIRNRLNLIHSDNLNLKRHEYKERVDWTQCSWMFRFIYLIFTNKHIDVDNIFNENKYLNNQLSGNNMLITGIIERILSVDVRIEFIMIFHHNDLEHKIKCRIWERNKNETATNPTFNSFNEQEIEEGDHVKVNIRFWAREGKQPGAYFNNIDVDRIEKLSKPKFFAEKEEK